MQVRIRIRINKFLNLCHFNQRSIFMIKFKSNIDKTTMAFDNRTEAIKFIRKNFKKLDGKIILDTGEDFHVLSPRSKEYFGIKNLF